MTARLRIRDGGGIMRVIRRISLRDRSNQPVTIQRVRVRDAGGTLRTVFAAISATIAPNPVEGLITVAVSGNIPTSSATVTVVGGLAPYTYAWTLKGTSAYAWTIGTPTAATTIFTAAAVPEGQLAQAVFTVAVTDAGGAVVNADVIANARNNYGLGAGTGVGAGSGTSGTGGTDPMPGGGYGGPPTVIP